MGKAIKKERRRRNSGIETKVRSIRAEVSFWERVQKSAKVSGASVNELIVQVVEGYMAEEDNG